MSVIITLYTLALVGACASSVIALALSLNTRKRSQFYPKYDATVFSVGPSDFLALTPSMHLSDTAVERIVKYFKEQGTDIRVLVLPPDSKLNTFTEVQQVPDHVLKESPFSAPSPTAQADVDRAMCSGGWCSMKNDKRLYCAKHWNELTEEQQKQWLEWPISDTRSPSSKV